jgi:hypothetical protein
MAQPERIRQEDRSLWDSIVNGLKRPRTRRVLMPAMAVAASLLLAVGLWYILLGRPVPTSPGAATGSAVGAIVVGGILLGIAVVVALALGRRKD